MPNRNFRIEVPEKRRWLGSQVEPREKARSTQDSHPLVVQYLKELADFIVWRLNTVIVFSKVASELTFGWSGFFKNKITTSIYWGRQGYYKSIAHISLSIVIIFVAVAQGYGRKSVIAGGDKGTIEVGNLITASDILVETGSAKTITPKDRPTLEMRKYVVKPGDTPSSIAEKYDVSSNTLLWANGLGDGEFISIGQELLIPPGNGVIHKVKKGDTISSIAEKYDVRKQDIYEVNWIDGPDVELKVGTKLFVPEAIIEQPIIVAQGDTGGGGGVSYSPASGSCFMRWPAGGGSLGYYLYHRPWFHNGIDILGSQNIPILAAASGRVTFVCNGCGWNSGYANSVEVDHGNGYRTFYAHMNYVSVKVGQKVGSGEKLGGMGATGNATGVHLHFELRRGASYNGYSRSTTDPLKHLKGWGCG